MNELGLSIPAYSSTVTENLLKRKFVSIKEEQSEDDEPSNKRVISQVSDLQPDTKIKDEKIVNGFDSRSS